MGKERNIGIDLLKIVSMLMIILIHLIGHGNILDVESSNMSTYNTVLLMRIVVNCAVNCYALITGYLYCEGDFRIGRIVRLWLNVFFYAFAITCLGTVISRTFNIRSFIGACLPVTFNQYWYFTAYFALFFLMPFLNKLIRALSQNEYKILLMIIFIVFSVMPTLGSRDIFSLNGGGSVWWLVCCYLFGAYIKKYQNCQIKGGMYIAVFIGVNVVTWGIYRLVECNAFLGKYIDKSYLIIYTSPAMAISALCLFKLFLQIMLKNHLLQKVVKRLAASSFSVYLIHDNSLVRNVFLLNKLEFLAEYNAIFVMLNLMGMALGVYIGCTLIDVCVNFLLGKIGVIKIEKFIEQKIKYVFVKLDKEIS